MEENILVHGLIKFGQRKHMEGLLNEGSVYMNPISFFKTMEEDEQRKDANEGDIRIEQVDWIKLSNGDITIEMSKTNTKGYILRNAQWRVSNQELRGNIYSMYAITSSMAEEARGIDPRCAKFGDTMVIIYDPGTFVDRVEAALKEKGIGCKYSPVVYYDPNAYSGNLSVFHKSTLYAHQSEFRIFAHHTIDEPITLKIGSIADFAYLTTSSNVEQIKLLRMPLDE